MFIHNRPVFAFSLLLCMLLILSYSLIHPITAQDDENFIQVTTPNDQFNTGAGCALREAVEAANNDEDFGGCVREGNAPYEIRIPEGIYTLTLENGGDEGSGNGAFFNASNDIDILAGELTIVGQNATTTIIQACEGVDCVGIDRVFDTSLTDLTILNLTIQYGNGDGGSAIRQGSNALTLVDVTLRNNGNDTSFGGAILAVRDVTLTRVTFANNTANTGGAIYNAINGNVRATNVTFYGNTALVSGGAIYNQETLNLTSVTMTNNTAIETGGGIYNEGQGSVTITSTIIDDNFAQANDDDGIGNNDDLDGPNIFGTITSQGFNLLGNTAGGTNNTLADLQPTDTIFGDAKLDPNGLQDNGGPTQTVALLIESPAVDAGFCNPNILLDQRSPGFARIADLTVPNVAGGNGCDIGAFEIQGRAQTVYNVDILIDDNSLDNCDDDIAEDCSLRGAISAANRSFVGTVPTINMLSGLHLRDIPGENEHSNATGDYDIRASMSIIGQGMAESIIDFCRINCGEFNSFGRVFQIHPDYAEVTISGVAMFRGRHQTGIGIYNNAQLTLTDVDINTSVVAFDTDGDVFVDDDNDVVPTFYQGNGGGIFNSFTGVLNATNVTIQGNRTNQSGGGIFNQGEITLNNVSITANTAVFSGGGVFNSGTATLNNVTISSNSAAGNNSGTGGGIGNSGVLTITDATIANNIASFGGGGVYSSGSGDVNATFNNVTFSSNFSGSGGGFYQTGFDPVAIFNQTTFSANIGNQGGAMFAGGKRIQLNSATITGNTASQGGGIYVFGLFPSGNSGIEGLFLDNALIAENIAITSSDIQGAAILQGFNLIGDSEGLFSIDENGAQSDPPATNILDIDPQLAPNGLQANGGFTQTVALLPNSPAVDAGQCGDQFTTDQRGEGFPRPMDFPNFDDAPGGDGCDIGAFELPYVPFMAVDDAYTTAYNTALIIDDNTGLIANDIVPENTTAQVILTSIPASGVLTIDNNGGFIYIPNAGFSGEDSVTYVLNDGFVNTNPATVTITVGEPDPTDEATATETETPTATATETTTEEPTTTITATDTPIPTVEITAEPTESVTPTSTQPPIVELTGCEADVPKDENTLRLLSPSGTLTNCPGNPTYYWPDTGALVYEIFVSRPNFTPLRSGGFVYETVSSARYCQERVCAVDLIYFTGSAWLSNDTYEVWLCDENCRDGANWVGPFAFTMQAGAVTTPTLTGYNGGALQWTLANGAENAGWFQVYLAPTDDIRSAIIFRWFDRETVCGSWGSTTCNLPITLASGVSYSWYVRSWGPSGLSTGGIQGWAEGAAFTP